jgi:hypothetical protein
LLRCREKATVRGSAADIAAANLHCGKDRRYGSWRDEGGLG